MRALLISSVLPRDTTASELVLYRHLARCSEFKLVIATDNAEGLTNQEIVEIPANPIITRLTKTRLSRWGHDIRQCFREFYNTNQLRYYLKNNKPDVILTVAHGELCGLAQQISQEFDIPLVTFFHDWWPDLAYVHSWARLILTHRFKQLYQRSSLAFCVSEEMRKALGKHPNAQVLFPISEQLVKKEFQATLANREQFRVVYAGNLSNVYSSRMQALSTSVQGIPDLQLQLFGPQPDWPDSIIQQCEEQGIYSGFVSRNVLVNQLWQANALLLTMSFNLRDKRRTQISLPSKLLEYCQFGKPVIIWGPEYCSAVHWGREHQAALLVTSPAAEELVKAIQELSRDFDEQQRLANKSLEMADNMFNPEKIQQQFIESFHNLASNNAHHLNHYSAL